MPTDVRVEAGLPILLETPCRVGCHVFIWSDNSAWYSHEPSETHRCTCRLLTWAQAKAAAASEPSNG